MYNNDIFNTLIGYMKEHNGKEISTRELVKLVTGLKLDNIDLINLHSELIDKCKDNGTELDTSNYADALIGMPYDIPYVIKVK